MGAARPRLTALYREQPDRVPLKVKGFATELVSQAMPTTIGVLNDPMMGAEAMTTGMRDDSRRALVEKVSDAVRQQWHNQLNRAGLIIRDTEFRNREVDQAFDTIGEWRSAHSHALREVYEVLEQRAKALDASAIVSLRLNPWSR